MSKPRVVITAASAYATPSPTTRRPAAKSSACIKTLKKWLTKQPAATTLAQLQAPLDTFTAYYNTQRPHRAIGRRTPFEAWAARLRAIPTRRGLHISEHFRVRKDRVDTALNL
jgi:Integrase core domain